MSHISKIELIINSLDDLKHACNQLGFTFVEDQKIYQFQRYVRINSLISSRNSSYGTRTLHIRPSIFFPAHNRNNIISIVKSFCNFMFLTRLRWVVECSNNKKSQNEKEGFQKLKKYAGDFGHQLQQITQNSVFYVELFLRIKSNG